MQFLSDGEKARIAEAIDNAERKTSGELVAVVIDRSDDYASLLILWAALIALILPSVVLLGFPALTASAGIGGVLLGQLGVFSVLACAFHFTPLALMLAPRALQASRARRMAREQFFAQGLHLTEGRTGVLLFVSVAERHVEILADKGIDDAVEQGAWKTIVENFVVKVREGEIAGGFLDTVSAAGALLERHAPRKASDRDELPNRFVALRYRDLS